MLFVPLSLTRGDASLYALVDERDVAVLADSWYLTHDGYAARSGTHERLHCAVLGLRGIDHITGDRLDCRRRNLRPATGAQNAQNVASVRGSSSQFRGATWNACCAKWQAQVKIAGRSYYLGVFTSESDAGAAASAFRKAHMPYSNEARS